MTVILGFCILKCFVPFSVKTYHQIFQRDLSKSATNSTRSSTPTTTTKKNFFHFTFNIFFHFGRALVMNAASVSWPSSSDTGVAGIQSLFNGFLGCPQEWKKRKSFLFFSEKNIIIIRQVCAHVKLEHAANGEA